jgi:hypothetical protein
MNGYKGILTHEEAKRLEVTQLGSSACGATAVVNVLLALRVVDANLLSSIDWSVCIVRKRDLTSPLPQYLSSRSMAGCTGSDLISSMNLITYSHGISSISGEFQSFNFVQSQSLSLIDYLAFLLQAGKAVVGTFNLQILGNDAWHHQLIYGVDTTARVVYCMNPMCCYPEDLVMRFMSTDSSLFIQRQDVLERVNWEAENCEIYDQPLWSLFKVREQIAALRLDSEEGTNSLQGINIPASYVGVIAVFKVD